MGCPAIGHDAPPCRWGRILTAKSTKKPTCEQVPRLRARSSSPRPIAKFHNVTPARHRPVTREDLGDPVSGIIHGAVMVISCAIFCHKRKAFPTGRIGFGLDVVDASCGYDLIYDRRQGSFGYTSSPTLIPPPMIDSQRTCSVHQINLHSTYQNEDNVCQKPHDTAPHNQPQVYGNYSLFPLIDEYGFFGLEFG